MIQGAKKSQREDHTEPLSAIQADQDRPGQVDARVLFRPSLFKMHLRTVKKLANGYLCSDKFEYVN